MGSLLYMRISEAVAGRISCSNHRDQTACAALFRAFKQINRGERGISRPKLPDGRRLLKLVINR